jgi:transposase-like protein
LAVDLRKRFIKCAECGAPFEVSRGFQTGKRPDAKYCSDRCRVSFYRGRIEEARRLASAGLTAMQIARKLNTSAGVINRWIATSRRKPRRHR